jgi:hypothetical protein
VSITGLITIIITTAIISTSGKTIYSLFAILALAVAYYFSKYNSRTIEELSDAKKQVPYSKEFALQFLLSIITIIGSIYIQLKFYLFEGNFYLNVNDIIHPDYHVADNLFYASVIQSAKVTGIENWFYEPFVANVADGCVAPYHFADIWASVFVTKLYGISSFSALTAVVLPVCNALIVLGAYTILRHFKTKIWIASLLAAWIGFWQPLNLFYIFDVLLTPFFQDIQPLLIQINKRQPYNQHFDGSVKFAFIFPMVLLAVVQWLNNRKLWAGLLVLIVGINFFGALPQTVLVALIIAAVLYFVDNKKSDGIFMFIICGVLCLGFLGFYKLFGNSDFVKTNFEFKFSTFLSEFFKNLGIAFGMQTAWKLLPLWLLAFFIKDKVVGRFVLGLLCFLLVLGFSTQLIIYTQSYEWVYFSVILSALLAIYVFKNRNVFFEIVVHIYPILIYVIASIVIQSIITDRDRNQIAEGSIAIFMLILVCIIVGKWASNLKFSVNKPLVFGLVIIGVSSLSSFRAYYRMPKVKKEAKTNMNFYNKIINNYVGKDANDSKGAYLIRTINNNIPLHHALGREITFWNNSITLTSIGTAHQINHWKKPEDQIWLKQLPYEIWLRNHNLELSIQNEQDNWPLYLKEQNIRFVLISKSVSKSERQLLWALATDSLENGSGMTCYRLK